VDRKGRRLFWTESALGPVRERLLADARRLIDHRQRAEAGRLPV